MDTYSTNNFSSRYSHGSSLPSAVKVMMFINVIFIGYKCKGIVTTYCSNGITTFFFKIEINYNRI